MTQTNNKEQFVRTKLLLGTTKTEKIFNSKVTVIGLGAVGSFAVEILARMGVGTLTLVDFDVVQESNINRQLYALHSTINLKKTELAKKRVLDINPDCKVNTLNVFVNTDTFEQIFSDVPDIVIDAIDSYNPKLRLLEYCYKNNIFNGCRIENRPFFRKICGFI